LEWSPLFLVAHFARSVTKGKKQNAPHDLGILSPQGWQNIEYDLEERFKPKASERVRAWALLKYGHGI
jgi:hypothetical protein